MGFEPMTPETQGNRLAGGRTRPLCDPSKVKHDYYKIALNIIIILLYAIKDTFNKY